MTMHVRECPVIMLWVMSPGLYCPKGSVDHNYEGRHYIGHEYICHSYTHHNCMGITMQTIMHSWLHLL